MAWMRSSAQRLLKFRTVTTVEQSQYFPSIANMEEVEYIQPVAYVVSKRCRTNFKHKDFLQIRCLPLVSDATDILQWIASRHLLSIVDEIALVIEIVKHCRSENIGVFEYPAINVHLGWSVLQEYSHVNQREKPKVSVLQLEPPWNCPTEKGGVRRRIEQRTWTGQ